MFNHVAAVVQALKARRRSKDRPAVDKDSGQRVPKDRRESRSPGDTCGDG